MKVSVGTIAVIAICATAAGQERSRSASLNAKNFARCIKVEADDEVHKLIPRNAGYEAAVIKISVIKTYGIQDIIRNISAHCSRNYPSGGPLEIHAHLDEITPAVNAAFDDLLKEEAAHDKNSEADRATEKAIIDDRASASLRVYIQCLKSNATNLAIDSKESAEIIQRAAFGACHDERDSLLKVRLAYGDPELQQVVVTTIDGRLADELILDVIKARSADALPSKSSR